MQALHNLLSSDSKLKNYIFSDTKWNYVKEIYNLM